MNHTNKTFAYIGIAGALTMALSDMILLGQPVSGSYYDISSFGAMQHIDSMRAALGSILGLVASFFICFGFWFLKKVFELVNQKLSTVLFIALSSIMFFGGAFHAGYYFISKPGLSPDSYNLIPQIVLNDFINHLELLSYLGVPGFLIGSILFFKLSLDEQFPKWLRYCNPLTLSFIFLAVFYFLPEPVGGYLKPTFLNLATASLFIFSTRV